MSQIEPLPLPSRFTIPQGAIVSGQSQSIPLHVLPIPGGGGYKVGIVVQAEDQYFNLTPAQMFEFDTGGQGFWLSPQHGIPTPDPSACPINIQYTSGIEYFAQPQQLTLKFTEAQPPLAVENVTVGVIGKIVDNNPKKQNEPVNFPIFGNFYGDFGAATQAFVQEGQTQTPANSLLTVLAQLPPPFNSGFIVDVGPYPGSDKNSVSSEPQLIVGLTQALRDLFPLQLPMTPAPLYTSPSGAQFTTFAENVIQGNLQIQPSGGPIASADNIGVVFDSGAPGAVVHPGNNVPPGFKAVAKDKLQLTPDVPNPVFALLGLTVGSTPGVNQVGSSKQNVLVVPEGYINTGITAFFQSPIMFDLHNKLICFPPAGIA